MDTNSVERKALKDLATLIKNLFTYTEIEEKNHDHGDLEYRNLGQKTSQHKMKDLRQKTMSYDEVSEWKIFQPRTRSEVENRRFE